MVVQFVVGNDMPVSSPRHSNRKKFQMKPTIKAVISPDVQDLSGYSPNEPDNFGFLLQLLIGPENEEGAESFQVMVCTPKWLSTKHEKTEVVIGRHLLIVFEYDHENLMSAIDSYVSQCNGHSWEEVALKLARFGRWEFEDYNPYLDLGDDKG